MTRPLPESFCGDSSSGWMLRTEPPPSTAASRYRTPRKLSPDTRQRCPWTTENFFWNTVAPRTRGFTRILRRHYGIDVATATELHRNDWDDLTWTQWCKKALHILADRIHQQSPDRVDPVETFYRGDHSPNDRQGHHSDRIQNLIDQLSRVNYICRLASISFAGSPPWPGPVAGQHWSGSWGRQTPG